MDAYNQPVVIDNGSGLLKAGFAGAEKPQTIFPAYVGRAKHRRAMAGGAADRDFFVGDKAKEIRGILKLNYPSEHGMINNWEDMLHVWRYAYEQLNVVQEEDHPVLLTEPPLNPRKQTVKSAETFFETFQVPAMYVQAQAILSLYASGRVTGVVIDSGDGVTHAVPVYEGFMVPHAVERIDVAGRDVTEYLQLLLRKSGYVFHTTAEKEIVKKIKEKVCYVAFNIDKTEKQDGDVVEGDSYKLPDNQVIQVQSERYQAPECLFNPALIGKEYMGVHDCVANAIKKSDLDIRRSLYSEIVLSGGSTLFRGYGNRLLTELRKLAPKNTKIRIYAPEERILSSWIGGSILAGLNTFKKMWWTKKDWQEYGKNIVYRKAW